MEKKTLTKEEIMELRTDHFVLKTGDQYYELIDDSQLQRALKKLYTFEQLINQGGCNIFPVPLGSEVYSYTIEHNHPSLHITTLTLENAPQITTEWETRYFPSQKALELYLLNDIAVDGIVLVSQDRDVWEYRYIHSINMGSTFPIKTYPHGWTRDLHEMYGKEGRVAELVRWKYFAKINENEKTR